MDDIGVYIYTGILESYVNIYVGPLLDIYDTSGASTGIL